MIEQFIANSFRAGSALLEALKHRDAHTEAHCTRVARYAWYTAKQLDIADSMLGCIVSGAVLHDVGKIGIPDDVLLKNGALDAEEFEVIKLHSSIGASIVEKLDIPTADKVSTLVRGHHERLDGRGYPDGLSGEQIPLGARIISAVDAFDAITSTRCYRQGLQVNDALAKLQTEQDARFGADVIGALAGVIAQHGQDLVIREEVLPCD